MKNYFLVLIILMAWMVSCDSSEKKDGKDTAAKTESAANGPSGKQSLSTDSRAPQGQAGIRDMPPEEISLEGLVNPEILMEFLEVAGPSDIKLVSSKENELIYSFPNIERPRELSHFTLTRGDVFKGSMEDVRNAGTGENKMFFDGVGDLGGYYEAGEVNQFRFPLKGYWYHMTMPDYFPMDLQAEKGRLMALRIWEMQNM